MKITNKKKILLFSTLNPYPFWAGSENFWFDFVADERTQKEIQFQIYLADSPVTRKKASEIAGQDVSINFYKHFNIDFTKRNLYRLGDKLSKRNYRTLPWYNGIKKNNCDAVWFNVAALQDLQDLAYPVQLCKKAGIPYWLILQHGNEDFFLSSEKEIELVSDVVSSAKKIIFIAHRNRLSLERALGYSLTNAFHSVNALTAKKIETAKTLSQKKLPSNDGTTRFFNLGRFSPADKGQHLLLEAFATDQWKDRNWQLSFIGISSFGEFSLKRLIKYYGLQEEKIKIMQHTENVFQEIIKNDVLLMPSLAEGTPFAMAEAMACGRPAMGTPVGGIPELIIENKTGWLSSTTDIKNVTECLEQVWQERNKWIEFGRNAQLHVEENYNQEKSHAILLEAIIADLN